MRLISMLLILLGFISISITSCIKANDAGSHETYQYVFSDPLNNDVNHWSFTDKTEKAYAAISNGGLHYVYHPAGWGTNSVVVKTGLPLAHQSFDIQTRIASDHAMALVFGVSPNEFGYSFFINDNDSFAVYDEGSPTTPRQAIIDWTHTAVIRTGWNDLELHASQNGYWNGYLNGVQVFSIPAHVLRGSQAGFMVLNNTNGDADFLELKW